MKVNRELRHTIALAITIGASLDVIPNQTIDSADAVIVPNYFRAPFDGPDPEPPNLALFRDSQVLASGVSVAGVPSSSRRRRLHHFPSRLD